MIDLIFLISIHSLQEGIHSFLQQVWVWIVWWYMIDWFDLPKLSSLSLDCDSFANTRSITLSSISLIFSSSDVPFSNGHYSISSRSSNWTFRYITSFISDSTSSRLKNCIINKGCSWSPVTSTPQFPYDDVLIVKELYHCHSFVLPIDVYLGLCLESHLHCLSILGLLVQQRISGILFILIA